MSFLYTPPTASCKTISSVSSSPVKSPALNKSIPVTFNFVEVTEPLYKPIPKLAKCVAQTFAISNNGATKPYEIPRCATHSPTAYTRGSKVCMVSFTTTPLSQWIPADSASAKLGRIPTANTNKSAGNSKPSLKRTALTRPLSSPTIVSVLVDRWNLRPLASKDFCSMMPAVLSNCFSNNHSFL